MRRYKQLIPADNSRFLLYQTKDGNTKIEVKLYNETVWLTQKQMAKLFSCSADNISLHIKNIYNTEELDKNSTVEEFSIVQKEGNRFIKRRIDFYNLDMIISVGYRVNSFRGTQFRIWATKHLKEYLIKGFVMDDERLSDGRIISGRNYFDELVQRIRKIRASEKNLYEKTKDIFTTSIDYNPNTEQAKEFFAAIQNKFHFAITGQTAAEIIVNRISSRKENLGLTSFQGKNVTRKDAEIAKNYMLEIELKQLYLLVEQFLSFAELRITREKPTYMEDWKKILDKILESNEFKILESKGKVSNIEMKEAVKKELAKYLQKSSVNKIIEE